MHRHSIPHDNAVNDAIRPKNLSPEPEKVRFDFIFYLRGKLLNYFLHHLHHLHHLHCLLNEETNSNEFCFLLNKVIPQKKVSTALISTLAGAVAGMMEVAFTWPTEFLKTQLQLQMKQGGFFFVFAALNPLLLFLLVIQNHDNSLNRQKNLKTPWSRSSKTQ